MKRFAWVAATLIVVLVIAGIVWARSKRDSPELAEVKQLQQQFREKMDKAAADGKPLSPEEGRAMFDEMRKKLDALPEADRDKARNEMGQQRRNEMQEQLKHFFALPPVDRAAEVDKLIDQQEAISLLGFGGFGGGPPGGGSGGPPRGDAPAGGATGGTQGSGAGGSSNGAAGSSSNSAAGGSTAASGTSGGTTARPAGQRGGFANATPEQRKNFQRSMLNGTTPEFRAQMTELARQVQQRRTERGLPEGNPFMVFGLMGMRGALSTSASSSSATNASTSTPASAPASAAGGR